VTGHRKVRTYDGHGALASYAATYNSSPLFSTGYTRDSLGRITEIAETIQGTSSTAAFTYDSAGRLFEVRRNGVLTATYLYDLNGNRTSLTTPSGMVSATTDAQDRLTAYGNATFEYTANGELRTRIDGADTTRYTYDALGNLVTVALPTGDTVSYVLDAANRRIGRRLNGTLTQGWLYQSQLAPVAELDGSGAVVSRFVYATHVNVPDYLVKGGQTYRLVLDHLGSVRLVVNTSDGTVAQRLDYDEYGRVTQNTSPGFQPFGYAGGLLDDATGLTRFGARDYDPVTGRWTAKDPGGFSGGANLYAYALNDPVNLTDPTGNFPALVAYIAWQAAQGALIGGGIDLALQLATNGGNLSCVDWGRVGHAALVGGISGGVLGGLFRSLGFFKAAASEVRYTGTAVSNIRATTAGERFLHYGYSEDAALFENGIRPGGWGTTAEGLTGAEARSGLALPHATAPNAVYTVTPEPGTLIQVNPTVAAKFGQPGGLSEVQFIHGTGFGTVSAPVLIP
jgi:RHS repeat-associated protein